MPTVKSKRPPKTPELFEWPTDLPYDDGEPMDTPWHRDQMMLLIDSLTAHWADRNDFYCGGNMFLYFSEEFARNRDFRGPDFFVVNGRVERTRTRKAWVVWEERGRSPDVIVELMSESTRSVDLGEKKDVYEKALRTPEYFCYDPDDMRLLGWRLVDFAYKPIKVDQSGRMWSKVLKLWLGPWDGDFVGTTTRWLRLFTKEGGLVRTHAEEEAFKVARERARADQEASGRKAAEAEVARLRQELANARRRNGKA